MTATDATIKRVKLYINDKYIDEDSEITVDTNDDYYEFSYYGNLKGVNKFVVKVDTERGANENDEIQFKIKSQSIVFGSNAEYTASQNQVESNDIN